MQITSLNFQNINKTNYFHPAVTFNRQKRDVSNNDTFIKRAERANLNMNLRPWDENRLHEIYDTTFEDIMTQTPLSETLNIEKPEIKIFKADETSPKGYYDIHLNTLFFSSRILEEDCYLITGHPKYNKPTKIYTITPKSSLDYIPKFAKRGKKIIKLSDEEKEFYIKGVIVHELRHCIQEHLLLATKSTSSEYLKYLLKTNERIKQQAHILQKNNKPIDACDGFNSYEELIEAYDKSSHITDYYPKKLIDDDLVLKFSVDPSDNRYWSTERHILKNALGTLDPVFIGIKYFSSPFEIDANHYAAEFLKQTSLKEHVVTKNREYIIQNSLSQADSWMHLLKLCGYPKLITKD